MKKSLLKNNFREISKNKRRFISMLVMAFLGVGFFAGLVATSPDMLDSLDKYADKSNFYDINIISTLGITDDDIQAVKNIDGVENAYGIQTKDSMVKIDNKESVCKVIEYNENVNTPVVIAGRKIENDKILMTHNDQTGECEYKDGKITLTADGTTMILSQEKEEYEPYVPGKPVENPTMKDFEGEWSCTLMEAFGMQMPVNADFTGFEMSMSVEDGKAEIILIESGEETKVELQGDVEGNALVLKAVTEDEAGTMFFSLDNMKFNLLDDGKLCLIAEDDAEESDDGEEADDSETGEVDFSVKTYFEKIIVTE